MQITLEVLISCMHQKDTSIIRRSNLQSDTVIINQCDRDNIEDITFVNDNNEKCQAHVVHTSVRGLSRSRNLAISHAHGEVCIICDDDEEFSADYVKQVTEAFQKIPEADVIAFQVTRTPPKNYPLRTKKLNAFDCLKVSSVEIAFRLAQIKEKKIFFDERIGSGVSKAGGEENIFLHDCLRKGLSVYFVPIIIAKLLPGESQWSSTRFSNEYFMDRGRFTRKLIGGKIFALFYALYFGISKYKLYKHKNTLTDAIKCMVKGIFEEQ